MNENKDRWDCDNDKRNLLEVFYDTDIRQRGLKIPKGK